jgi:hypothetical protein
MPEQTKGPVKIYKRISTILVGAVGSNNGTLKRPNVYRRCSPHPEANSY